MTETLREVDWPEAGRFVILDHQLPATDARPSHWDLMLETPDGLVTFEALPFQAGQEVVRLRRLPNHRLAYLDYEGPISNNRGCVRRVDRGHYHVAATENGTVSLELHGTRFYGSARLHPTIPRPAEPGPEQGRARDGCDQSGPVTVPEQHPTLVTRDVRTRTNTPTNARDCDRSEPRRPVSDDQLSNEQLRNEQWRNGEAPFRMATDDRYTRMATVTDVTPFSEIDAGLGTRPTGSAANRPELGISMDRSASTRTSPEAQGGPQEVARNPSVPVHDRWIMDATGLSQSPHEGSPTKVKE